MMKRFFSLLICLMLICSIVSVPAFAEGSAKGKSVLSSDKLCPGDLLTVSVSVSNCAPFKSFGLKFEFDDSVFSIESGEWLIENALLEDFNIEKKTASLAFSKAATADGDIFKYVLKVKTDAPVKTAEIKTTASVKNGTTVIDCPVDTVSVSIICKTHTYSDWSKKDDNNHVRACSKCGTEEISSHAWDAGKITSQATCKDVGVKEFTCTECGATKSEEVAKTTTHTFGEWTVAEAATCTAKGKETRSCSVCGQTESREIAAKGHSFGEWTVTKEATCTEKGSEKRTCPVCSESETREIAAKGHKYGEAVVTKEATKTEAGSKTYTCAVCGHTKTEEIPRLPDESDPTSVPTEVPTEAPTEVPTEVPTEAPSSEPGVSPEPTEAPTEAGNTPVVTEPAAKTSEPVVNPTNKPAKQGGGSNALPWIIAGIAILALIAVIIIMLMNKKKQNTKN